METRATTYTYDIAGRPTGMRYPGNNFELSYSYYPGTGLVHTLEGSDMRKYAEFSSYEPSGKIGRIEYSNGVFTTYSYDNKSTRLTGILTNTGSGEISKNYDYTPGGSLASITPDPPSVSLPMALNYAYRLNSFGDNIHELTSVTDQSTSIAFDDFTYDANGNMTNCPDLTDSGNTGIRAITYNSQHMPEQVTSTATGKTMNLFYDGNGMRAKKTVNGATTYYVGPHFEIHDGVEEQYIFAGSIRIAMKRGSDTFYFHKDHLGSTIAVTDQSGAVRERIDYLPFGGEAYHSGERIVRQKFTDQEYDSEVNLYNYNARLYDPTLRRFTAADTIVPDYTSPQTLNRYSYCLNNPLNYTDPSGHLRVQFSGTSMGIEISGEVSSTKGPKEGVGLNATPTLMGGRFEITSDIDDGDEFEAHGFGIFGGYYTNQETEISGIYAGVDLGVPGVDSMPLEDFVVELSDFLESLTLGVASQFYDYGEDNESRGDSTSERGSATENNGPDDSDYGGIGGR